MLRESKLGKLAQQAYGLLRPFTFFHFPFYPLSSCQTFLPSHFCTDWLSRLGLGNQVGLTTDHF